MPYTLAQRSLNTVIDGFGSRNPFTYYGCLRVKILVSSDGNRELNLRSEEHSNGGLSTRTGCILPENKPELFSSSVFTCHVLSMY